MCDISYVNAVDVVGNNPCGLDGQLWGRRPNLKHAPASFFLAQGSENELVVVPLTTDEVDGPQLCIFNTAAVDEFFVDNFFRVDGVSTVAEGEETQWKGAAPDHGSKNFGGFVQLVGCDFCGHRGFGWCLVVGWWLVVWGVRVCD